MPILHLRITPDTDGLTKVTLSNTIRGQQVRLMKAVIVKPNTSYTDANCKVRLPFLTGQEIHSNDLRGFLTIPNDPASQFVNIDFNLNIGADHIPEVFEAQLVDASGDNITSTANFTSVDLYFDYLTNSLY